MTSPDVGHGPAATPAPGSPAPGSPENAAHEGEAPENGAPAAAAPVAAAPAPPAARRAPGGEPMLPEQSPEDTDAAWGDYPERSEDRLLRDRPPHWSDS
jgi:hypothetical protein